MRAFVVALVLSAVAAGTARAELFLVAEPPAQAVHHDSYVLPLSDPRDIAHARDLIQQGPSAGAPIAVAHIAARADGINRDYLAPTPREWSWHVTEFLGFADAAIEICDGWPTYVESDVDGWIANTNGTICFWSYTVVQELEANPEPSSLLLLGLGALGLLGYAWRRKRV
jgi:hypothetical protein